MAKCEHMFEPSDRCPRCKKERLDQQFGAGLSGEVGSNYRPKSPTKLNLREAREENAEHYDPKKSQDAMTEFVQKSFTTELEQKPKKKDVD